MKQWLRSKKATRSNANGVNKQERNQEDSMNRTVGVYLFWIGICLVLPVSCLAQAWILPKGDTTISLSYYYSDVPYHTLADGSEIPGEGGVKSHLAFAACTYSLTSKFAFDISLPYVTSKYVNGLDVHDPTIDDGNYHS